MLSEQRISSTELRHLILWPALITLAVSLLRFAGEMLHWSPRLFSREAGGAGALVGIVWLIPVFGVYLAVRLLRAGAGPASAGRAAGFALLAFALNTALGFGAFAAFKSPVAQLAVFTATSWLTLALARPGWPQLWRALLYYALCARIPVLLLMLVSIFGGLDTHYAKPRPDFPPMGPAGLFFWTALLPQLSIWIYLTIVVGMLVGAPAVLIAGRRPVVARP